MTLFHNLIMLLFELLVVAMFLATLGLIIEMIPSEVGAIVWLFRVGLLACGAGFVILILSLGGEWDRGV